MTTFAGLLRAVGIGSVLASGLLLGWALLPVPAQLICGRTCSTFRMGLVMGAAAVVMALSSLLLGRLVHRWYWRVAILLLLILAWEPIQHVLAVNLPDP